MQFLHQTTMRKTKVLMLGWEFPPLINGGLGVACLGMAKSLSRHVDLSIILPKTDPNFIVNNVELIGLNNLQLSDIHQEDVQVNYKEFSDVEYIDAEFLPYQTSESKELNILGSAVERFSRTTQADLDAFKLDDLYGSDVIGKVIQYSKVATRLALAKDFDIIHAHDWMTFLAGVEIKKATGKPLALHVHSLNYDRVGPDGRGWVYDLEKYGMEQADLLLPVSHYTGSIIQSHYGIDSSKIKAVHNGVEPVKTYRVSPSFPEKLVLFLGRVTVQKGPEFFLDIASEVFKLNSKVRFVMAGTGDKLKRLIESGAYKHIGDKFHFTGFLNKDKVHRLLAMADVYCMPSVSEPFGLSALEAAQFGIPAVISKQSGAAEVMKGALKADYWDTQLMAKHINDLITNDVLRDKVVADGYEDLKTLSWDTASDKIVKIFNEYLNNHSYA